MNKQSKTLIISCSFIVALIITTSYSNLKRLDKIEDSIENITTLNTEFAIINSELENLKDKTEALENSTSEDVKMQISSNVASAISAQFLSIKDENFAVDSLFTSKSDVIATDTLAKAEYTAEQLAGKKLLLTYKEDNNDIIFYGQFNENNHWDGNCIINVYSNNRLIAITEGLYNDGNLHTYKQAFVDIDLLGKEKWFISSRTHIEDYNTGNTSQYTYTEFQKEFDVSSISSKDIITVDFFVSSLTSSLESFYHGNTSNGQFNDDTNSAYYISYNDNSKSIKTLYVGNFKDGNFHDTTGKAWYITKAINTDYMYYIGKFENGHPIEPETKKNFINPISLQQRNEIIKDMKFDCEIKWFDDTTSF